MHSCQMRLPEVGAGGQERLQASSIAVVGVGGLGCAALPYLAGSGIGAIALIDGDRVEEGNLARQVLFGPADIGALKTCAAVNRLAAQFPRVAFHEKALFLDGGNAAFLLEPYDLVLDATDNLDARYAIDDACRTLGRPWIYASVERWEGQVALFEPAVSSYRDLFPVNDPERNNACELGGVLGAFVGLVGAIEAIEAVRWLVRAPKTLANTLLAIDAKEWRFRTIALAPEKADPLEISWERAALLLQTQGAQLVDIREPEERKAIHPRALSLPLSQFHRDRLPPAPITILHCRQGARSFRLARQLREEGMNVYSAGGINGWQ